MTTDALTTRPSITHRRRGPRRKPLHFSLALLLGSVMALPVAATPLEAEATQAQVQTPVAAAAADTHLTPDLAVEQAPAPVADAHPPSEAAASHGALAGTPAAPAEPAAHHQDGGSLSSRAAEAASATLAALLPRLASNDTLPLLDRSVLLAGDLSRLLQLYPSGDLPAGNAESAGDSATGKVRTLLERATALLGTPYRWGGTSPDSGFDCSGLVGYVFRTALGIELPRVSRDMARQADAELIKNREDLQQGDLVFFGRRGRVDHVGIYVGEGRFVHAPSRGKDVRVDSITGGYWGAKFMQARRVEM